MMKILANRKIKSLFNKILLCMAVFTLLPAAFLKSAPGYAAVYLLLCPLCLGLGAMAACYGYFREQNEIMERAVEQIREYLGGSGGARIDSDEEGELYRLFHEVNSLVAILNAHAENEGRAKKSLKNTISDISHQLKTPLAALSIYNGIMQQEAADAPTVREFAALSEQELDRIQTLVQNLLDITKFDAGTVVLEKACENVSEMMESVKKRFAFRAGQEGKEILLKGDETITFWCDKGWLLEAVGNIVKNALDHMGKGGVVRVEWEISASMFQITVKDNGSGIHPEDLYYIFKRFYRSRYSKDTKGIGLGLPLAKSVIEMHNGTVKVDSELGVGTVFTMDFHSATRKKQA